MVMAGTEPPYHEPDVDTGNPLTRARMLLAPEQLRADNIDRIRGLTTPTASGTLLTT